MNRLHPNDGSLKGQLSALIIECINSNQKLPSEKEMMERFGVSRSALRDALSVYEASGLIVSQQGSGRYVNSPAIGAQIIDSWAIFISAKPILYLELQKIRAMLELGSVPKIINTIGIPQLQALNRVVGKMKDLAAEGQGFPEQDREFHSILISCTENTLLMQLMDAYWDLREKFNFSKYQENTPILATQHEEIVDAIMHKDCARTTELLQEQFEDAEYQAMMLLVSDRPFQYDICI